MEKPRIAVHKFASCDGCQLAFLNAGEALLALARRVHFVHFAEAGINDPDAPADIAFVEGSITTADDARCIRQVRARPYLVGPLARLNLHFARLPAEVRERAHATGISWPSRNMYHSAVARALEILFALREAIGLLAHYAETAAPAVTVMPRAGEGFGASEAPRGLLWHHYVFDAQGRVRTARIVPPTSQNQARIEEDLAANLSAFGLDRDEESLRLRAEQVIRNYDPCISCATHFLRLRLERT